ncbi:neuroblast differentiation-associated protein AHNAK-like [Amphibalanus amphitrite]|uniref:neuroblast differentiation-associated protein AHNAK-like n=1 Tax=Amphibalanus amphitrite TaxID=1232801 RepID=UPI001C8FD375|nr:neuroblast differentiation-associated protein AHNAK-like [Amphibalanus amphitrite]
MKGREVVVSTEIPDVDVPKLSADLKTEKVIQPDGKIKNVLTQKFKGNAELPLPKVSGADIDDIKLPDGSIKTSFKPKAGFKWPKISLPSLQLPDWEFGSGDRSPSPERKEKDKEDGDFSFGIKMPSFGFGKGAKIPKLDGVDGLLGYLLPESELPKLRIRDNTEVNVIDLPDMKGREVVVSTEIPDVDLPKLSADLKTEKIALPDGKVKNVLTQKFKGNAELPLLKVSGADIDDIKLPDGSIKTSFKPKAGFKWPQISLPSLQLPDWEFVSGDRAPSPERKEKDKEDSDFSFGIKMPSFGFGKGAKVPKLDGVDGLLGYLLPESELPKLRIRDNTEVAKPERKEKDKEDSDFSFGIKMPSFGFGKGAKVPKLDGVDGLLGYLLPESELPKLRIRDNTEVDVIDLPDMKGREVVVSTEIPDVDLPKLSADLKTEKITLPDGEIKNVLTQKFKGNAELPLPKVSGADIDDLKLPDGSIKTSFKPKVGFKWPKISLPSLQLPDWDFGSGDRSPSPERKEKDKEDSDFSFGIKMPSFGFGKESELPKLRIRDNTEVDVIDLPDMKGREVVVSTEIPDVDLPKLSADLKTEKITLPDGEIKNVLTQKFKGNAELPLPKVSGADIDDLKLPDGSIKTSFKPKAGFKWPKISLPSLQLPDWDFGSGDRSPARRKGERQGR